MQDLESLSSKTILELREIGKVLGIKGALKKQELIDRINELAHKNKTLNIDFDFFLKPLNLIYIPY